MYTRTRTRTGLRALGWTPVYKEDAVLVVWPGGPRVREKQRPYIMVFFAEEFDIVPTIVGSVETIPDKDEDGGDVPGTGGRNDFFFYVDKSDVMKFCDKRVKYGMRWWEDIYFNRGEGIYPSAFLAAFPDEIYQNNPVAKAHQDLIQGMLREINGNR